MKRILALFGVLVLSACGISEKKVNYPTGELTPEDLKPILLRAVEMEKKYATKTTIYSLATEESSNLFEIVYYKGDYRYCKMEIQTTDGSVTKDEIVSYTTSDNLHAYFYTSQDGSPYKKTDDQKPGDYVGDDVIDVFTFAYGYGQIGPSAAALVVQQSGLNYKNNSEIYQPKNIVSEKGKKEYTVTFSIDNPTSLCFKMSLNKYGCLEFLQVGTVGQDGNLIMASAGYKTEFGKRQKAPKEIDDLFKNYRV